MRVSDLVKQLFSVMNKHGDLPVIGGFAIDGKELRLSAPDDTEILSVDDSEILSALLRAQKDGRTTP
jgi:hypothetical protein